MNILRFGLLSTHFTMSSDVSSIVLALSLKDDLFLGEFIAALGEFMGDLNLVTFCWEIMRPGEIFSLDGISLEAFESLESILWLDTTVFEGLLSNIVISDAFIFWGEVLLVCLDNFAVFHRLDPIVSSRSISDSSSFCWQAIISSKIDCTTRPMFFDDCYIWKHLDKPLRMVVRMFSNSLASIESSLF